MSLERLGKHFTSTYLAALVCLSLAAQLGCGRRKPPRKPPQAAVAPSSQPTQTVLSERLRAKLTPLLRPSVQLFAGPVATGATPASYLGGRPTLPAGLKWPTRGGKPLAFLAQVRLSDVTAALPTSALPTRGMFFVFYDDIDQPWGFDPADQGGSAILFWPEEPTSPEVDPPTEKKPTLFRRAALTMKRQTTWPDLESPTLEGVRLSSRDREAYSAYLDTLQPDDDAPISRLLGHPDTIQGPMETECQLASNGILLDGSNAAKTPRAVELLKSAGDWRLLLQLDSYADLGMMWGDVGRLYFWIRVEDLAARRFDKVWLVVQCY